MIHSILNPTFEFSLMIIIHVIWRTAWLILLYYCMPLTVLTFDAFYILYVVLEHYDVISCES